MSAHPVPARLCRDLLFAGSSEVLQAYRRLALRVIAQAFRDLRHGTPELRLNALQFLTDYAQLELWCSLAEVSARRVSARALSQCPPVGGDGLGRPGLADRSQAVGGMSKLASARSSVS